MKQTIIKTVAMILLGLLLGGIVTHLIDKGLKAQKLATSMERLKTAHKALTVAEEEYGFMPGENWESQLVGIVDLKYITDPHKIPTNGGSGWGMNLRTNLRSGEITKDTAERRSSEMDPKAILLLPWAEESFSPNRNGTIPPPNFHKTQKDPIWEYGEQIPVLRVDGSVNAVSRNEIKNQLKLKLEPYSIKIRKGLEAEEKFLAKQKEEEAKKQTTFKGGVILNNQSLKTPLIPSRSLPPTISFEIRSDTPQEVEATIIFINQDGREINYTKYAKRMKSPTNLALGKRGVSLKESKIEEKITNPGFNPKNGHAEIVTDADFPKGVEIVETSNLTAKSRRMANPMWAEVEISAGFLPDFTESFQIQFEKAGNTPLEIRNIKIRFENP